VKSEAAYTLATSGKDLETLLREMKPSHSSGSSGALSASLTANSIGTAKAAVAGTANSSLRPRG
jgi:hypothetical protein